VGLRVDIYRANYRSGRNIFGDVDAITLINVSGPSDPTPEAPAAILNNGPMGTLNIVPEDQFSKFEHLGAGFLMFGGSYAATSDSRFHEAVRNAGGPGHVAIAIHDFYETYEENARMD
jgi:hypothetical protein